MEIGKIRNVHKRWKMVERKTRTVNNRVQRVFQQAKEYSTDYSMKVKLEVADPGSGALLTF